MRQELDELLCNKYPKIFRDRFAPMTETCMCWGFACGDGWFNILNQLCGNIQHHIDWSHKNYDWDVKYNAMISKAIAGDRTELEKYFKGYFNAEDQIQEALDQGLRAVRPVIPQVVATQVKEKFGTLRFYYEGGDDIINGMVRMAEAMSGVTCEECSAPAETHGPGWIRTICESCEEKRNKEQEL